ncbi:uncharacterized protein LOC144115343 isoform X2 [Amblyomma americanum]
MVEPLRCAGAPMWRVLRGRRPPTRAQPLDEQRQLLAQQAPTKHRGLALQWRHLSPKEEMAVEECYRWKPAYFSDETWCKLPDDIKKCYGNVHKDRSIKERKGFGVKAQQQAVIIQPVFVGAYSTAIVHWQSGKAAGSHGATAASSGGMRAENRTLRHATFTFNLPEYGAGEEAETGVIMVQRLLLPLRTSEPGLLGGGQHGRGHKAVERTAAIAALSLLAATYARHAGGTDQQELRPSFATPGAAAASYTGTAFSTGTLFCSSANSARARGNDGSAAVPSATGTL